MPATRWGKRRGARLPGSSGSATAFRGPRRRCSTPLATSFEVSNFFGSSLLDQVPDIVACERPFEGRLEPCVRALVTIIVGAAAPKEFASGENVAMGPQQVRRGIFAFVEGGVVLEVGGVDFREAVAEGGAPLLRPLG